MFIDKAVPGFITKRISAGVVFSGSEPNPHTLQHHGVLIDITISPPHRVYCGELSNYVEHGSGNVQFANGSKAYGE